MFPTRDVIQGVLIRTRMEERLREADDERLAHPALEAQSDSTTSHGRHVGPSIGTQVHDWLVHGPSGLGWHVHLPGPRHGQGHPA